MAHVFISYSHHDTEFAKHMSMRLKEDGITVWDMGELQAGDEWGQEIDQQLRSSNAVLVIMSPSAKRSDYVTYEWAFTLGAALPVVPILLHKTKLHARLARLQHLDFTASHRPWDQLIERLAKLRRASAAGTGQAIDSSPPRWLSVEVSPMKTFQNAFMMMQLWVRNVSEVEAQAVRASLTWRRSGRMGKTATKKASAYWTIKKATGLAGYTGVSEVVDLYTNRDPQHLASLVRELNGPKVYIASTGSYHGGAQYPNWQHPDWLVAPGNYSVDVKFDAMKARRANVTLRVIVRRNGEVLVQVQP